jgi:hypothetical protein
VKLLPTSRRGRVALAGGLLAALLGGYWYVFEYRPWEPAHYRLRPTSWWDREVQDWKALDFAHPVPGPAPSWARLRPEPPWRAWQRWVTGRPGVINPRWDDWDTHMPLLTGDPAAVSVLSGLLRSPYSNSRLLAADGLRQVGPEARAAAPSLVALLRDDDAAVRDMARATLRRIDPELLAAYDREHPQEERP